MRYCIVRFPDAVKSNSVYSRHDVYQSQKCSTSLWGKGFCSIGEVTYATAQYCACLCS